MKACATGLIEDDVIEDNEELYGEDSIEDNEELFGEDSIEDDEELLDEEVTESEDEERSISGGDDSKKCKKKCFLKAGLLGKRKECAKESIPDDFKKKVKACMKPLVIPVFMGCKKKCGKDKACKMACVKAAGLKDKKKECKEKSGWAELEPKIKACMEKFVTPDLKACMKACATGLIEDDVI